MAIISGVKRDVVLVGNAEEVAASKVRLWGGGVCPWDKSMVKMPSPPYPCFSLQSFYESKHS